ELARGGGRVDGFGEGAEADALGLQRVEGVDQLLHRAGQAIELPDHQRVAGPEIVESGSKLRPHLLGARDHLDKDLLAAGCLQGSELQLRALIECRDASVADEMMVRSHNSQNMPFGQNDYKNIFRERSS